MLLLFQRVTSRKNNGRRKIMTASAVSLWCVGDPSSNSFTNRSASACACPYRSRSFPTS